MKSSSSAAMNPLRGQRGEGVRACGRAGVRACVRESVGASSHALHVANARVAQRVGHQHLPQLGVRVRVRARSRPPAPEEAARGWCVNTAGRRARCWRSVNGRRRGLMATGEVRARGLEWGRRQAG
eukprot:scaffold90589_cov36-Phaeocystis_antarctica.AAC.1